MATTGGTWFGLERWTRRKVGHGAAKEEPVVHDELPGYPVGSASLTKREKRQPTRQKVQQHPLMYPVRSCFRFGITYFFGVYGIEVAGIQATIATVFDGAEPLDRDAAKAMTATFLREFRHVNLTPEDVTLTGSDDLFRFDLKISFFAGLGIVAISANKIEMSFRDMKTKADVDLVSSVVVTIGGIVSDKAMHSTSALTIAFHAHLKSGGDRMSYFTSLVAKVNGLQPQAVGFYRSEAPFLPEVRAVIERSNSLSNGVYFNWNGVIPGIITAEILGKMKESIYGFLKIMNLEPAEGTVLL